MTWGCSKQCKKKGKGCHIPAFMMENEPTWKKARVLRDVWVREELGCPALAVRTALGEVKACLCLRGFKEWEKVFTMMSTSFSVQFTNF